MEVRFTPEEEARLTRIATQEGVDPAELLKDAALRLLEDDLRFRLASERALEQADRGEFIKEEEMDARVKRMFQPWSLKRTLRAIQTTAAPAQQKTAVTTYSYRHIVKASFYTAYSIAHVNPKRNSPQSPLPCQEPIHRPFVQRLRRVYR